MIQWNVPGFLTDALGDRTVNEPDLNKKPGEWGAACPQ